MSRSCSICAHGQREAIETALAESTPNRRIAAQYRVTEQAVRRHKASHLPAALAKATGARAVAHGDNLLGQVNDLQAKTLGILAKAEAAGDLRAATGAIREARATVELLARLLGQLQTSGANASTVNIAVGVVGIAPPARPVVELSDAQLAAIINGERDALCDGCPGRDARLRVLHPVDSR